ncbi:cytochrome c family protein [uncultured Massilia sp.]|uniref:c-type cytochrome n=1 Tax=uncultured Massilia sp. TaxID=169973 RepID=UPI0025F884F2|nr:c-type cytochrome [uncultured Massilia sp.]
MHKFVLALALAAGTAHAQPADEVGRKTFETCAACHSFKEGDNGTGPSLHAIVGRKAGTVEGFRYSGPLKRSNIVWDEASLTAFLRDPQQAVPGNRMPFSGIEDEAALKAVVRYLQAQAK